ncbi:adenylate kinase [Erysipelotrichaceae bacterium RD49]|nr:adenylate kinase [Erysipelotrichaceae bacterium RD49]
MNLLIMGAPGSGKGTFSSRLKDNYKLAHISTGDIFRKNIKENTALGQEAKSYMDKGLLVPDDLVNRLVLDTLQNLPDGAAGYLLDGYPRTLEQAKAFDEATKGTANEVETVLYMDVPHEVLNKRILGRRTCPKCGEIYNIYFKPTKEENICDSCGNELSYRADDNEESLKTRLHEYDSMTQPVIDFYAAQDKVTTIDADNDFETIWDQIQKALAK